MKKKTLLRTMSESVEVLDSPAMMLAYSRSVERRNDLNTREKRYLQLKILKRMNLVWYQNNLEGRYDRK